MSFAGNVTTGALGFGKGDRAGGGVSINFQNVDLVRAILSEIQSDLRPTANKELRKGTIEIAKERVIPALKMSAYSSGVPIAPALADTMRAVSDRVVTVRVGGVNPKLSGFRSYRGVKRATGSRASGRDATSRSDRTTLAWGSEMGPFAPGVKNNYGVPRRPGGYWVRPGINAPGTLASVKDAYSDLLERIIAKYGRYR